MGGRPKGSTDYRTVARRRAKTRVLKQEGITAERTMLEIARCAFSDIGDCFDEAGNLLPIDAMPADVRKAVASVKTLKTNVVSGDGAQETTREIRMWDKVNSLRTLAQHFGLISDKTEVNVTVELQAVSAALNRIKERNRAKALAAKGDE